MGRFSIMELADASYLAGDLFRATFASELPAHGRHFVSLYRSARDTYHTAGYIHFSAFEGVYLAGGLIANKAVYSLASPGDLAELGPRPSIGEFTMREGIERLGPCAAVFASIGIPRSVTLNLNVGYVRTHVDNLFACWRADLDPATRTAIVDRVARVMPF